MKLLLLLLFVFFLSTPVAKASCLESDTGRKRPVGPIFKPLAKGLEEVDKAACAVLDIQYADFVTAAGDGKRTTNLANTLGMDGLLVVFKELNKEASKRDLTPGEIGNCRRHLGIKEETLAELQKKSWKVIELR